MKKMLLIGGALLLLGSIQAGQLVYDFKPQLTKYLYVEAKNFVTTAPAMRLDSADPAPKGKNYRGTAFNLPRQQLQNWKGKNFYLEFQAQRLKGNAKLYVDIRFINTVGGWKKIMPSRGLCVKKGDKIWQKHQINFTIPDRSDLTDVDVSIRFYPKNKTSVIWLVDDVKLFQVGK